MAYMRQGKLTKTLDRRVCNKSVLPGTVAADRYILMNSRADTYSQNIPDSSMHEIIYFKSLPEVLVCCTSVCQLSRSLLRSLFIARSGQQVERAKSTSITSCLSVTATVATNTLDMQQSTFAGTIAWDGAQP